MILARQAKHPNSQWCSPCCLGWFRESSTILIAIAVFWIGLWPGGGPPAALASAPLQDQQIITVPKDKSRILDLRESIARVSVANPAIADILVINPKQIYLNGKELGSTNMTLWDDKDQVQRQIGVEVTHDVETLKEKLYRVLPGERVKVESARGSIVLSGTASSATRMESAVQLAKTYAAADKVINLIQIGGGQQVLLEVRVAEVSRILGKALDSNLLASYDDGNGFRVGAINGLVNNKQYEITQKSYVPLPDGKGGITYDTNEQVVGLKNLITPFFAGPLSNALIASITSGNFTMDMYLRAAEDQGLGRILAEPNLTTLSGQQAEFLSGGQIPYSTTNVNGTNTEWKNYGIELRFIPFVMENGKINLKVNVSVSEPGPPALSNGQESTTIVSRGAKSSVEVPSGQTIAIAGLLSQKATDSQSKFPGLGNIPVLGALFRTQNLKNDQTELLIFVTPKLANPIDTKQVKLPTDGFVDPTDIEFYLMGKMTSHRSDISVTKPEKGSSNQRLGPDKAGAEGVFGHDL